MGRTSHHMRSQRTMLSRLPRSLIVTVGVLSLSILACAQVSLVHVTSCGPQTFPTSTCTIPSTGAGNVLVAAWASENGGGGTTIASVSDNAGNVYADAGGARTTDTAASRKNAQAIARHISFRMVKRPYPFVSPIGITDCGQARKGCKENYRLLAGIFSKLPPSSPLASSV